MSSDTSGPKSPTRAADAARPTVLVVDDDLVTRVFVRRMLEEAGYQVTEAGSGRDALVRLRGAALPHYLVTDLKMADGSGGWLVSQVGYEFPALLPRTVVITGDATGAAAAHVAARWRCPIVAKPITGPALLDALRQVGERADDR